MKSIAHPFWCCALVAFFWSQGASSSSEEEARVKKIRAIAAEDESSKFEDLVAARKFIERHEGVYKNRFKNGLVTGESFESENILEIVKVSDDAVYFKTHLEFYNGHSCGQFGVAKLRKNKRFVFLGAEHNPNDFCKLDIEIKDHEIVFHDDPLYPCRNLTCGARGGYDGVAFKLSERRKIKYMKLLKNSEDFKNSLKTAGIKP